MNFFKNRKQLLATIKEKDKELLRLRNELKISNFKMKNHKVLEKYTEGSYVSPDIIIIDPKVVLKSPITPDKSSISSFWGFMGFLFKNIKAVQVAAFEFECMDLKNKQKIKLSLEEIKALNIN